MNVSESVLEQIRKLYLCPVIIHNYVYVKCKQLLKMTILKSSYVLYAIVGSFSSSMICSDWREAAENLTMHGDKQDATSEFCLITYLFAHVWLWGS